MHRQPRHSKCRNTTCSVRIGCSSRNPFVLMMVCVLRDLRQVGKEARNRVVFGLAVCHVVFFT
jgi:hypothetical protein